METLALVRGAAEVETTFTDFVVRMRGFGRWRGEVLSLWLERQPAGVVPVPFEGSEEELGVIGEHLEGERSETWK
jgi:hypothetical protein